MIYETVFNKHTKEPIAVSIETGFQTFDDVLIALGVPTVHHTNGMLIYKIGNDLNVAYSKVKIND